MDRDIVGAVINTIGREADRFASLLDPNNLEAAVPSCPGWTVRDLTDHLGGVHRWAAQATRTPPDGRVGSEPVGPESFTDLRDWFRAGAAELLGALRVDPHTPCWTLAEPRRVAFWIRRQLHETTLHGWDLLTAIGGRATVDRWVALDGLDEVVSVLLPRQVRLGRLEPGPETISLEPVGAEPITLATRADGQPVATVTGEPETLLLLLWRRIGLDDDRLTVDGDRSATRRLLERPLTP